MRVKGHTLRSEGAAYSRGEDGVRHMRARWNTTSGVGYGLCSCGEVSDILDSANLRKAWHRNHKAEVAS